MNSFILIKWDAKLVPLPPLICPIPDLHLAVKGISSGPASRVQSKFGSATHGEDRELVTKAELLVGDKAYPFRLRILIADDFPDAAESAALFFRNQGFDTQVAYDGEEAWRRIEAWHPHVCVLDLAMPKMDGFQIVGRVRANAGESPLLIAVTGWVDAKNIAAVLAAGFDCFMEKPAEPMKLLHVIKSQLLMWPSHLH